MTLEQICTLFNVFCVFVPVVFSIGITFFNDEAYFRYWTLSASFIFLTLSLELYCQGHGRPFLASTIEALVCLVSGWASSRMGDALDGRHLTGRAFFALAATAFIGGQVLTLSGLRSDLASVLVLLFYVGTQVLLGVRLAGGRGMAGRWLGGLICFTALWNLTYPAFSELGCGWVGFLVSGSLHLLSGVGVVLFLFVDIARKLARQNVELKTAERLQTEFISNVSHEFRTPLSAIKTGTYLLANGAPERWSVEEREILGIIAANVERSIRLVDDVLDASKLASETMLYEFDVADLGLLVQQVASTFNAGFDAKQVALTLHLPPQEVIAEVDHRRIEQVLSHLLANALKFTPAGGSVAVRLTSGEDYARLEVSDSGIGIARENLEKVFARFYQVDGSTRRKAGGTGLGLSICQAIVMVGHHGKIWAESAGAGTRICVSLPLDAPELAPIPLRGLPA